MNTPTKEAESRMIDMDAGTELTIRDVINHRNSALLTLAGFLAVPLRYVWHGQLIDHIQIGKNGTPLQIMDEKLEKIVIVENKVYLSQGPQLPFLARPWGRNGVGGSSEVIRAIG
jgi:hypothetical protein